MQYTITINKDILYYDISAILNKGEGVRNRQDTISSYNFKASKNDELDHNLLARKTDARYNEVVVMLQAYLVAEEELETTATNQVTSGDYVFVIDMPDTWKPALRKPLADAIHNYIMYGALREYYLDTLPELAKTVDPTPYANNIQLYITQRTGMAKRNSVIPFL